MGPAPDDLAGSLAEQAADLIGQVDGVAPDVEKALALFGRAATVSSWAAAADESVGHLDAIIDQGYFLVTAAGRRPRLLFPPAPSLLEAMSFLAWSYLERFEFRLDFFDLDEAHR
jgi:hypothetical protein